MDAVSEGYQMPNEGRKSMDVASFVNVNFALFTNQLKLVSVDGIDEFAHKSAFC